MSELHWLTGHLGLYGETDRERVRRVLEVYRKTGMFSPDLGELQQAFNAVFPA